LKVKGLLRFGVGDPWERCSAPMARPVHPVADLFPMMTNEELDDLAADIKTNGLVHPIVVDKDGFLIDGRNRARACEIAGIEPTTVLFEGDDPRAYIIASSNGLSDETVSSWVDKYGRQFGLYRPMRLADPAHVQPSAGWHELGAALRNKRLAVQPELKSASTARSNLDNPISLYSTQLM